MLEKMKGYKKITAAILTLAAAVMQEAGGLDAGTAELITQGLMAYLISQGIADAGEYAGKYLSNQKSKP